MTPIRDSVSDLLTLTHFVGAFVGGVTVIVSEELGWSVFWLGVPALIISRLACQWFGRRTLRRYGL